MESFGMFCLGPTYPASSQQEVFFPTTHTPTTAATVL